MSYCIQVECPHCCQVIHALKEHDVRGAAYAPGGTTDLSFNITYNYSPFFYKVFGEKGIRVLYGMRVIESIPLLERAINSMSGDPDPDYWVATEGNAREALRSLKKLAELSTFVDCAVWNGD